MDGGSTLSGLTLSTTVAVAAFSYLLLLFAIAWVGDRRARQGRSLIDNPYIYALSLGAYCTSWTFYGSVGLAATAGIAFLPIYLGPTLLMTLGFLIPAKVLRIAKQRRITSIADFISARYGRSQGLGGLVAVLAVVGVTPYIALQLKAVSLSFDILTGADAAAGAGVMPAVTADDAFYVALLMAAFAMVFGTRSIDAAEHHEGMVAAIAFESLVKLVAFLAVGAAVVWGLHDGFGDLFRQAASSAVAAPLLSADPALADGTWIANTVLAFLAALLLPRQFQLMVVENKAEAHLSRAMWLFPLYLLLINLFVLPVAVAGLLRFEAGTVDRDMVMLALVLDEGWDLLAFLAFLGGLSAATGMIIVETVALSTMVCNAIAVPLLLRLGLLAQGRGDLGRLLLRIRRAAIVAVLLLGYGYYRSAGSAYALVTIGLISFTAVAQFAPALIGGIFWSGATRRGAIAGLVAGTAAWLYTLLLPSFARSEWLPASFIEAGPWGIAMLRPYSLFGLEGLAPVSHALFWSLLANIGLYILVSLLDRPDVSERLQADGFVQAFQAEERPSPASTWRGTMTVAALKGLVARFLGAERTDQAFQEIAGTEANPQQPASAALVRWAERQLAGAIGSASARVALTSVMGGRTVDTEELLQMLDETSHVIEYSRQLEQKSAELERISAALRAANERLLEVDRLKDDFLSMVSHELRTPLTSVRAFAEILHDTPDIAPEQRQDFLNRIIRESERLTRLINQVLDMAKMESGVVDLRIEPIEAAVIVQEAVSTTTQLLREKGIGLDLALPADLPPIRGDRDRLTQVLLNLLSNAIKFAPASGGRIAVSARAEPEGVRISVADNGPGIAPQDIEAIFERFRQVSRRPADRPQGTGLGLAICKRIVEHLGGRIWVDSRPGQGAAFHVLLPYAAEAAASTGAVPSDGQA